jgi:hypothetical protein
MVLSHCRYAVVVTLLLTRHTHSQDVDESELSQEEQKERRIMRLLLKVKNGTPPQRKSALRQLTEKARELGTL